MFFFGRRPLSRIHDILGTGEHGVGIGKKEYLVEELGEGTVRFMRTIKKAVDPLGLFNPGKVSGFQRPLEKNAFQNDNPCFISVVSRSPRVKVNEEIMLLSTSMYILSIPLKSSLDLSLYLHSQPK